MKTKLFISLVVITGILSGSLIALADEDSNSINTQKFLEEEAAIIEPGVLPNSFWYWADKFAEEIRFVVTVGKEKKADFLMDIAKERLEEMKKLSEQGITKHADELLTEHEETITKAQALYVQIKEESIDSAKEFQDDTEREILKKEQVLKKELGNAEETYLKKQDNFAKRIGSWMKKIVGHLSGKREAIQEQRSEVLDE